MSDNKWVRSISFNKTNEKDIARLKLIGKKSFSRFVKKLLDDEIKRQNTNTTESVKPTATTNNGTPQQQQQIVMKVNSKPVVSQKQYNQSTPKPYNPMLQGYRKDQ